MGKPIDLNRYRTIVRDAEKLYEANPNETQAAVLQSARALLAEKEKEAGINKSSFDGGLRADHGLNAITGTNRVCHNMTRWNGSKTVTKEECHTVTPPEELPGKMLQSLRLEGESDSPTQNWNDAGPNSVFKEGSYD